MNILSASPILRNLLIALLLVACLPSVPLHAQCDIPTPNENCVWQYGGLNTTPIEISFLPVVASCTVNVQWKVRYCTIGGVMVAYQVQVMGWDFSSCPALESYFNSLLDPVWSQQMHNMHLTLTRALFEYQATQVYYEGGLPHPQMHCIEEPPSCKATAQYGKLQIMAVWSDCAEYVKFGNGPTLSCEGSYGYAECVGGGCCMQQSEICWDPTLGKPRICETWVRLSGEGNTECFGTSSITAPQGCTIARRTGCTATLCGSSIEP